jgi:hypothetical protein
MEDHIAAQVKLWGFMGLAEITAYSLDTSSQIFMYLCAGVGSLATAYYYAFKKK